MHFLVGSSALNRLDKVLTNKRFLTDVAKLSHHSQTPTVESFHGVIQRFAPKNAVFPFTGMLCRYAQSRRTPPCIKHVLIKANVNGGTNYLQKLVLFSEGVRHE